MKKTFSLLVMAILLFASGCLFSQDHEYVDLGLPSGTLWATCNVGANTPEEYGDYFAWGETTPKTTYNWNTYKYCKSGDEKQLTKYCNRTDYGYNGFTDNLTTLLPEDDAATVNWGEGWCTPTKEQWEELKQNTDFYHTQRNGVGGWKFTASNGNSLFLPTAGHRRDDVLDRLSGYWSSSTSSLAGSWFFNFLGSPWYTDNAPRFCGFSIRPVRSCSMAQTQESKVQHIDYDGFLKKIWDFEKNPNEFVFKGTTAVIVGFYSDLCSPSPVLERLANEYYDQLTVYKVNVNQAQNLAAVFQVSTIPTTLFIPKKGKPMMKVGAVSEAEFRKVVEEQLLK